MKVGEILKFLEDNVSDETIRGQGVDGIKQLVANLNEEAKQNRLGKESIEAKFASMDEQNKALLEAVKGVAEATTGKEIDVNNLNSDSDIVKRLANDIKTMQETMKTEQEKVAQANEANAQLLKDSAVRKVLSPTVRDDALDLLVKQVSGDIIVAEDGNFQTKEGVLIDKYIPTILEKYPSLVKPSSTGGGSLEQDPPSNNNNNNNGRTQFTEFAKSKE